jgi:hypothetical protein
MLFFRTSNGFCGPDLTARHRRSHTPVQGGKGIMIEVTAAATQQVAEYFKGKKVSPIRIFLNSGG